MIKLLTGIALTMILVAPAQAQSERAEQMRRVIDGLNSADPVTRIITLEEAISSNDKAIMRIAIQTAISSSDTTLRTMAVEGILSTKNSLTIELISYQDDRARYILDRSGGQIDLKIVDYDKNSGDFLTYSSFSAIRNIPNSSKRGPLTNSANFSGDRLSFTVNVGEIATTFSKNCVGIAQANDGSSVMSGQMSCDGGTNGVFGIEIDVLR